MEWHPATSKMFAVKTNHNNQQLLNIQPSSRGKKANPARSPAGRKKNSHALFISEYKWNGGYQLWFPPLEPTGNADLPPLLLPGALLMTMRAQLLTQLMFVNLCFS